MRRRRRIPIDGVLLHRVQRWHNLGACFFDDQDRFAYLGWLRDTFEREGCHLHACVLMCISWLQGQLQRVQEGPQLVQPAVVFQFV